MYFGLCTSARRFYFKCSLLILKCQLKLLKILRSESISLKLLVAFSPCMSREAWEAAQPLAHKVRAGEQRSPAEELWVAPCRGLGLPMSLHTPHAASQLRDVVSEQRFKPACSSVYCGGCWFFFSPFHVFLSRESVYSLLGGTGGRWQFPCRPATFFLPAGLFSPLSHTYTNTYHFFVQWLTWPLVLAGRG